MRTRIAPVLVLALAGCTYVGAPAALAPYTGHDGFKHYEANPFTEASKDHLSTFAVDVDTASYALARRQITEGHVPNPDSVRVEEFVNYFRYAYPQPTDGAPFSINVDAAPSPYTDGRVLVRVGLQGRKVSKSERKPAHLTFLVDVSGSMSSRDRLPLAKRALRVLVDNLNDGDTVGLVTYAGSVKEVLPPTDLSQKARIFQAIEDLTAGGGTFMSSGMTLAYRQAANMVRPGHISRVVVLTDGDANIGTTSHEDILDEISGYVKEGVTLSTVGFGMGNYQDEKLEQLADKGNGNAFYVDSLAQAKRIFQQELGGTLEVIAKDAKVQVDFDSHTVKRYRLVGYENRDVADRDFANDDVDGGEIGSGHSVTAMYEVELAPGAAGPLATVHVRAKPPEGNVSQEWTRSFGTAEVAKTFAEASTDFRFATAVVGAAEILRRSPEGKSWNFAKVQEVAQGAAPAGNAERQEFVQLLATVRPMASQLAAN